MSEADRILRERERAESQKAKSEQAAREASAKRDEASLVAEVRELTAEVLRLLKAANYPDMQGVMIERRRFFGTRNVRIGAWRLGTHDFTAHGETGVGDIRLLSDGTFNLSGTYGGTAARTLDDPYLLKRISSVRSGLIQLRSRLAP